MTRLRYLSAALVIGAGIILSLCSCTTEEELRDQRVNLAVRHFDRAKYREVPETALTLQQCIELALEHNLDLKASKMEEQVGNRQKVAELLRMLPEINFNYTSTPTSLSRAFIPSTFGSISKRSSNIRIRLMMFCKSFIR